MGVPGSVNSLLAAGGPTQYKVERSLRFNSSDSAYCSFLPSTSGNRKKWTLSIWVKRSKLGSSQAILHLYNYPTPAYYDTNFAFNSSDQLVFNNYDTSAWNGQLTTAAVFRDCSAWYHIVCSCDTDAATPIKIYVNNVQQTLSGTQPSAGSNTGFSYAATHRLGINYDVGNGLNNGFNGYFAECIFVDGQALTPSSFAETNATTGQWVPKAYTGSYGTNGFKLTFSDNSNTTATTLGKDTSPNGNNFTPTNFSVTAGAGNDSLVDTPTSYGTDDSLGGSVRGNYATLNPLAKGSDVSLANGNLDCTTSSTAGYSSVLATIGVTSGKWYWEFTAGSGTLRIGLGIATQAHNLSTWLGGDAYGWEYFNADGNKYTNGSGGAYGATWTNGDVIGVAFDADAGTLTFYKNGATQGQAYSGLTSGPYFPAVADSGTAGILAGSFNFGQRPFAYTAPSGFKALCDTNLPTPVVAKPSTAFDVKLYTGNGSTQTVSGLGLSPDFVWIKQRSGTVGHLLYDQIRGGSMYLQSNTTGAEGNQGTNKGLYAFTTDGFSVGDQTDGAYGVNGNNITHAAWCWDAGSSNTTNTSGTITSTVRVNASSGFSIVTYTGTGATGGTIGHGLGVAPSLIIAKSRDASRGWIVYHKDLTKDKYIELNTTTAASSTTNVWGSAEPTSSVFGVYAWSTAANNANAEKYVAYCFAPVAGYSSMGSYSAGSEPFVYLGFRPAFLLVKCSTSAENWNIFDNRRSASGSNVIGYSLQPNLSNAEYQSEPGIDFLSNGFKLKGSVNTAGQTYIYAAFAESPLQYSRAR